MLRTARLSLSSVWAIASVVLPLLLIAALRMGSVDLTYHLRAGAMMLETRALLRVDSFTFTAAGAPWVDQQWLAQIVLALVFQAGGWFALMLTRVLLSGAALALVFATCRSRGATMRRAAWLTMGGAALLLPTLQLRPQLFGVVAFALTLWLLADRHARTIRLWCLVPVVMLWANLHGTFVLAFGLIGLAWLEDLNERRAGASRLVFVGIAAIAASFVNPFGVGVWRYVWDLSSNPSVRALAAEWQATSFDSYSGATFLVSVVVTAGLLWRERAVTRWSTWLTLAVFLVIGLMSVRGVYWWALVTPTVLAASRLGRERHARPDPSNKANLFIVGALVTTLALLLSRWTPYQRALPVPGSMITEAPMGVTESLRVVLRPGERVFGAQAWGSWLEFALPDHPVAVDSRIELFPVDVWTRYALVSRGDAGWQRVLDEWQVRVVAVNPQQQPLLIQRLTPDSAWQLVHRDADGLVFVRR